MGAWDGAPGKPGGCAIKSAAKGASTNRTTRDRKSLEVDMTVGLELIDLQRDTDRHKFRNTLYRKITNSVKFLKIPRLRKELVE
jgi:hypothetical protein